MTAFDWIMGGERNLLFMGWRASLVGGHRALRMEAIALFRFEAIASRNKTKVCMEYIRRSLQDVSLHTDFAYGVTSDSGAHGGTTA